MQCGGFCKTELTPEYRMALNTKRNEIETQLEKAFDQFETLEVKHQVVAGMNLIFRIKTQKEGEECIFVKLFRDLQGVVHLVDIHSNKSLSDELVMIIPDT